MKTTRRSFLTLALATAVVLATPALAIDGMVDTETLYADGVNDDSVALNAWLRGMPVRWKNGGPVEPVLEDKTFLLRHPLTYSLYPKPEDVRGLHLIRGCTFKVVSDFVVIPYDPDTSLAHEGGTLMRTAQIDIQSAHIVPTGSRVVTGFRIVSTRHHKHN